MPRLAKAVNFLAIRQFVHGIDTARFVKALPYTRANMLALDFIP